MSILNDRGMCIIADAMGLGNTLQILALLRLRELEQPALIVVPSSILTQWSEETSPLSGYEPDEWWVVKGGESHMTLNSTKFHILSYDQLKVQYKTHVLNLDKLNRQESITDMRGCPLFNMRFGYLIMDEAHFTRNNETKIYESLLKIQRAETIVVTGTLFTNEYLDIASIFELLTLAPMNDRPWFEDMFIHPIKREK